MTRKKVVKRTIKSTGMLSVVVGRLDKKKSIKVKPGTTIINAMGKGGFRKADNEAIQDINGNVFNGSEIVENKIAYFLIQRVKSGSY